MASATPDLRLPSRPQSITVLWPTPNCTAWWQRHMGVNNLPRVVAWRWCTGRESNPEPLDLGSDTLTTVTILNGSHGSCDILTRDPPIFHQPSKSQQNIQKFTVNTHGCSWTVMF